MLLNVCSSRPDAVDRPELAVQGALQVEIAPGMRMEGLGLRRVGVRVRVGNEGGVRVECKRSGEGESEDEGSGSG